LNPIFAAALELQSFCDRQAWRFCFIGGVAVQRWGEPRLTQDVDLSLLTGFGGEERYVDALLGGFSGRRSDARDFALENRVVLLESASGIPLDVALGAMPFEERAVERASAFAVGTGVSLLTCAAEDLVVFKVFAGREKDWLDVEGIVLRQGTSLDTELVFRELEPLLELKEAPEAADRFRAMLGRARSRS
jgi:hypothetical protein